MLETIDARAELSHAPRDLHLWSQTRHADGRRSWRLPEVPDGISWVSIAEAPDGKRRARVEGNLTALLHGPECAVGSLTLEELRPALERFHGQALALLGGGPDMPEWNLHRLDPSATYYSDTPAADVIGAAVASWRMAKNARQVVSAHNNETATFRLTRWRSWSVYNKRSEAVAKRNPYVSPGGSPLLRLEARLRPRAAESADFKGFRPSLALTADDQEVIVSEVDALTQSIQRIAATGVLLVVRSLIKQGATPNEAMRIASVMQLVTSYGDGILDELGVPERTVQRWKAEVRKFSAPDVVSDAADDLPTVARLLTPLLARDVKKGEV